MIMTKVWHWLLFEISGRVQDFDLAKRHYGEVITNFDPDNSDARARFKRVKAMKKDLGIIRDVRSCSSCINACLRIETGIVPARSVGNVCHEQPNYRMMSVMAGGFALDLQLNLHGLHPTYMPKCVEASDSMGPC